MELLYLYIEDDGKNIKDCEFNFSSEYHFSYNREERFITATKNSDFIENFWEASNISNITAIIGKNGVGKSNLFKFIVKPTIKNNLIVIYRTDDIFEIYTNVVNIEIRHFDTNYIIKEFRDHNSSLIDPVMYYTNSMYQDVFSIRDKSLINISLKSLINIDLQNHSINGTNAGGSYISHGKIIPLGGTLHYHEYGNFYRQIEFLNSLSSLSLEDINLPKYCIVQPYSLVFNEKIKANKQVLDTVKFCTDLFLKSYSAEKQRKDNYKAFWYLAFSLELYSYCLDVGLKDIAEEFIYKNKLIHYRSFTLLFFHTIDYKVGSNNKFVKKIHELFKSLDQILNQIEDISEILDLNYFKLSLKDAKKVLEVYSKLLLAYNESLIEKYFYKETNKRSLYFEQCFKIKWSHSLSSGEETYLNFFANLNYAKSNNINSSSHILLILDEPEISLHPELQRKFMNILLQVLPQIFSQHRVQVLIASHSPIIVSDFPKSNIIFLNKNEDGTCKVIDSISRDNTFGANIQTLYRNSFFLDGLPIGEFAKKKINKLFDELEHGDIRETTLQEIQLVGEPLLRDQLMKLYKQNQDLLPIVDQRITQLEEEVRILKNRLNDKNRT